ncbi:MAG: N-acetylglucosamine kinase [Alphaproteobacteria bacterium]|nr:N-acetylglucosamine kinase [Alphaproteobacteria bacterium]HPF46078.1 BadF/BadG/BcrA/BcrD ATPase family protein [Emcibacteraceae bacterium]HRW30456.1 BadF/BadG/BcrA/BcrD ATPase family protein [Emcibacteraceae bacterium]
MFLGVDSGGTKTDFILINHTGEIIATHSAPTTYYHEVGLAVAEKTITDGILTICQKAGISPENITFCFFGIPSYGEDREITPMLDDLPAKILRKNQYLCGNDMICGWAGSFGGKDGINIVAGTGSIGYGEYRGRTARSGGWCEIFGDEGSAYWIAREGLAQFTRMADGRAKKGPLFEIIMKQLSLVEPFDLIGRIMSDFNNERSKIAGLAQYIFEAAKAGDSSAIEVFMKAGKELSSIIEAIRMQLNWPVNESIPVSYSGGVFNSGDLILSPLKDKLNSKSEYYELVKPAYSPVIGAALYAAKTANMPVSIKTLSGN